MGQGCRALLLAALGQGRHSWRRAGARRCGRAAQGFSASSRPAAHRPEPHTHAPGASPHLHAPLCFICTSTCVRACPPPAFSLNVQCTMYPPCAVYIGLYIGRLMRPSRGRQPPWRTWSRCAACCSCRARSSRQRTGSSRWVTGQGAGGGDAGGRAWQAGAASCAAHHASARPSARRRCPVVPQALAALRHQATGAGTRRRRFACPFARPPALRCNATYSREQIVKRVERQPATSTSTPAAQAMHAALEAEATADIAAAAVAEAVVAADNAAVAAAAAAAPPAAAPAKPAPAPPAPPPAPSPVKLPGGITLSQLTQPTMSQVRRGGCGLCVCSGLWAV